MTDFEQLYDTYFNDVYLYILRLSGNEHLAEEITQDVFVRAMKSKKPFEGRSQELTWLCAIAKNACTDELRRQSKLAVSESDKYNQDEKVSDNSFEAMLANEELLFQIHTILHELEEPYKEVFQLRIFGELSFSTIARIFGKTESWARVTYHRARLKLQERVK